MILVTGANGVVGRQVMNQLAQEGTAVTAVTRGTGGARLPDGVAAVRGDLFHPEWIEAALEGVEALQISPRAAGPGLGELLRLAVKQGVRRAVLLSATTVQYPAGEARFAARFKHAEELVMSSGLDWTVLRLADFAANALAWASQIRAGDVVRGAYGRAATSPIHETDIAAVAVRALRGSLRTEAIHTLTGPQSLDQIEKVRLIGAAIGRTLSFQELPPEQVRQGMLAQGLPEEIPARLLGSLADYANRPGPTTSTVENLVGRPALTFADWAHDNAPAFGG
ncbi:NAD-dependent epimerase/dehydratase family protein [Streptomyces cyaneochromogenes]|uniref:NAD-dependent epimerase/dehydratase family protein n=1 Tax=Streptomyces cyaneochromogenes TaxID=2496836 RepID=A0A3Q9EN28_9ACTN|nr:NAD(P)H-binding protein [Streptomyces cyaneochromogenes]AZQ35420.1 NAD-dependent epimerase/dehydratase family protein [Streptomyces cyaneochromogenes]